MTLPSTSRSTTSALCRSCDLLRDELDRLRRALGAEVKENRWFGHNMALEYSRVISRPDHQYLYVHCEPAWGETPEQFEARYAKVIVNERDRLARRKPGASVRVSQRPEPTSDLFSRRIR